jgi:hypothetical protein
LQILDCLFVARQRGAYGAIDACNRHNSALHENVREID